MDRTKTVQTYPSTFCRRLSLAVLTTVVLFTAAFFNNQVGAQATKAATKAEVLEATESLFEAVHKNDLAAVQASVASGADIRATNDWGVTPVDLAVDKGHFDIAHYLLSVRNNRAANSPDTQQAQAGTSPPAAQVNTLFAPPPPAMPVGSVEAGPLSSQPVPQFTGPNPFDPGNTLAGSRLPVAGQDADPVAVATAPAPRTAPGTAAEPSQPKSIVKTSPAPVTASAYVSAAQAPQLASASAVRRSTTNRSPIDLMFGAVYSLLQNREKKPSVPVQAARLPTVPRQQEPVILPPDHLKGVVLTVGQSGTLGRPLSGTDTEDGNCVVFNRGLTALCVQQMEWPENIKQYFDIDTVLYKGAKAIIRYDGGTATRYHILFPTDSFADVVAIFQRRFGPPTKSGTVPVSYLGAAQNENSVVSWISADSQKNFVTELEIRAIDDVRGGLPDTRHGVIILKPAAGAPNLPRRKLLKLMTKRAGV